jgi:hypothetical protein
VISVLTEAVSSEKYRKMKNRNITIKGTNIGAAIAGDESLMTLAG